MTARTRWGVLATGRIAASFARDLTLLPAAELAAVGSRSVESARRFADEHGFARAHGSWAELAADPDVDVVYVATPHPAHHEAAKMCLLAGKHVLCEKPFTLDLATTLDLVETARKAGVFLMEAMWMRANPTIRRIQEVVASGHIGEVIGVTASFGFPAPPDPGHRLRSRALGGGALLDLGVYPITLAHLFLGEPTTISARSTLSDQGVDETTGLVFGYDGPAVSILTCSIAGDQDNRATIVGSTGRVELPRGFHHPRSFTICRGEDVETVDSPWRGNGLGYEAEEVMNCLAQGLTESPLIPLDDTVAIMRTMDAIRARNGVTYD